MPTEVTEIGPCQRRISVSIPKDEIQKAIQRTWSQARNQIQLKGFRPGKVPKKILERKYGDAIREEVKQNLVNQAYRDALEQHDLDPISQPHLDLDSLPFDPESEFRFELTLEIRPKFELPEYKGLPVGAPPVVVRDEDVERELEKIRSGHATAEPVEEGVASKGDYLIADVEIAVDGAVVAHHEDRIVDTNRDLVDGLPTEGGTAAFAGKKVGDTVTTPVHLPADFEPEGFAGAEAELRSTIKEVRRITLPPVDDEFAKKVGTESVDDLKEKVREQVERNQESERNRFVEEAVLNELIGRTSFDLPPDLLEKATREKVHELEHRMIGSGMPETEAKANAASHTDRLRQEETRSLRVSFLIDAIGRAEKVSVADAEIESSVRAIAAMHQQDPQKVFDELYEAGRLPALRAQILEGKVRKMLREAAEITDLEEDRAGS